MVSLLAAFALETVDPCEYAGWDELVAAHDGVSVFHSSAWARVLRDTYGHRPFYCCEFDEGRLKRLLPVMEVSSRWTGKRGVSLPFTDEVKALGGAAADGARLYASAADLGRQRGWKYLECRGGCDGWPGASSSLAFYGHTVDLSTGPEVLFKKLEGSVRRGIRKAEQSGVRIDFDSGVEGIRTFYQLHCGTRKRHGVPPQPIRFFENIARYLLAAGHGFVAIARHEKTPIAASVFFHFGREAVYKFGASDFGFQQFRPNNLVMWAGIKRLAEQGCQRLEMGRTSLGNQGLRQFKRGFASEERRVNYCKFNCRTQEFVQERDQAEGWYNHIFRRLPSPLLRVAGQVLYPHLS